jgi:hypothetical protein
MAIRKLIEAKIRGKWWRIKKKRNLYSGKDKVHGYCDYEERAIYYEPTKHAFGTLIHETLHACYPDLDEGCIAEGEEAILAVLVAAGFAHQYDK